MKNQKDLIKELQWYAKELKIKLADLETKLKKERLNRQRLERQLSNISSGISFKVGRIITYIPRKILKRN